MQEQPIKFHSPGSNVVRSVSGRFRNIKSAIIVIAYSVFFFLPWLRWEREVGPDQSVIFTLGSHSPRFYIFDLVFHPQDVIWLSSFLFLAAVLLFFITTIYGRVFCGYFCFQTLWTDVFRWFEHTIQGDRVKRIKLKNSPWSASKILKYSLTWLSWGTVSAVTAITFVLYWGDAYSLLPSIFNGSAPFAAYVTIIILTSSTLLAAGLIKEGVCTHICPYSRFQSAMFDENTAIVSYDFNRGEADKGRSKALKGLRELDERHAEGVGDCVDCGLCVQVCPMSIDIRDGLQIECIHCALCIDACDNIMDSYGWPQGLIRYTSKNELAGKPKKWFGFRTVSYGIATIAATAALVLSIVYSATLVIDIRHKRQPLYTMLSDGTIKNTYNISLQNKTQRPAEFKIELEGLDGAVVSLGKLESVTVKPDSRQRVLVKVLYPPEAPRLRNKRRPINFVFIPLSGEFTEAVRKSDIFNLP